MSDLDELIERLERAAAQLRSGELESERAAELVEELASAAAQAGSQLDRAVRAQDAPQGQLELE